MRASQFSLPAKKMGCPDPPSLRFGVASKPGNDKKWVDKFISEPF
jgi:hypothetical protein